MAVPFGFSIGDFLAAIDLVSTVIDALRETSKSSSTFRSLINELYDLETALISVKRLDGEISHIDKVALHSAASRCQQTIDAFYKKIRKRQPHLLAPGTTSTLKAAWSKVMWATCERKDLDAFRAEIMSHTSSIKILLMTLQLKNSSLQGREQEKNNTSISSMLQSLSSQMMHKMRRITDSIAVTAQQGKALLELSAKIVSTNVRIYQVVHDIQLFILRIPGQVQRQQPIYLLDPFNMEMPFHLEFIQSKDALLAVLKTNLKKTECGPGMIDRNEFSIEERGTNALIDLSRPWEMCFYPGQRVAMSMIFTQNKMPVGSRCPRCRNCQQASVGEEITCAICGTVFRHIKGRSNGPTSVPGMDGEEKTITEVSDQRSSIGPRSAMKRKLGDSDLEDNDTDTDICKFRRIQVISPWARFGEIDSTNGHRAKLYTLRANDWVDIGTGFCTFRKEKVEGFLVIQMEDQSSETLVYTFPITRADYQKQQETLLVWTENDGTDMALSFQDENGCQQVWSALEGNLEVSRHLQAPPWNRDYRDYSDYIEPEQVMGEGWDEQIFRTSGRRHTQADIRESITHDLLI